MIEGVWNNRFRYVEELKRMGADIEVNDTTATINANASKMHGANVRAIDLRAGAAMVIAGLAATGTTEIEEIHHIERGYTNLVDKLRGLGADISRISVPEGSSVYSVV
jgi:UDP-N-acetylglucosamine 1-carboxyvinyltransferase